MTFPELYKLDTPSISTLNMGNKNKDRGIEVFTVLATALAIYFNGNWTASQLADIGEELFDEYHYLSFAELAQFAKKAKIGLFGESGKPLIYGQFSPALLMDWFSRYAQDNLKEREMFFMNHRKPFLDGNGVLQQPWQEPKNPVSSERIKQLADEMEAEFKEENRSEMLNRQDKLDEAAKERMREQNEVRAQLNDLAKDLPL